MAITPIARVTVDLRMDNGTVMNLAEGDIVRGLKYKVNGKIFTVDGAVRVINGFTKTKNTKSDECVHEPYLYEYITISSIVVDSSTAFDAELNTVQIANIISIESVEKNAGVIAIGTGAQYKPMAQVIAEAPAGSTIKMASGVYDAPITLDKDIKLIGDGTVEINGPIVIGNSVQTASDDGSVVKAPKVYLEGLELTGDSTITIKEADEFTMVGCTFGGHNLTKTTRPILFTSNHPCLININNNTFKAENEFSYNLIEITASFKDGSSICGNTFEKDCCTHNQISLYYAEDGAVIDINDNDCVESMNMMRIGFIGEPTCTINMDGNKYEITDTVEEYAGLFLIQPYGSKTVSFGNVTINVSNTKKPDGQLAYMYIGNSDTKLTEDQYPTVFIDGVKTVLPRHGVQLVIEVEPEVAETI